MSYLTRREKQIFNLMLTDASPKEIAWNLKISYNTLDFHRKNMYRKLSVHSRLELFNKYSCESGGDVSRIGQFSRQANFSPAV